MESNSLEYKDISVIDLYYDYPYLMMKDSFSKNSFIKKDNYNKSLIVSNMNISYTNNNKINVLFQTISGVKIDKNIQKANYVIINNKFIEPISKISGNVIYFNNTYKVETVTPLFIRSNFDILKVTDSNIYFENKHYDYIDIYIDVVKPIDIKFSLMEIKWNLAIW